MGRSGGASAQAAPPAVPPDAGRGGAIDERPVLQAALDAATGVLVLPPGRIFGVSAPLVVPNGVGLDGNGSIIRALPGFAGPAVLRMGAPSAPYTSTLGLRGVVVDCNEQADAATGAAVAGIQVDHGRAFTIHAPVVFKARGHGIRVVDGYQVRLVAPEIFGSSPRSLRGGTRLPEGEARGILLETADCQVIGGAVQHFRTGFEDRAGSNVVYGLHVWSTYWSDDIALEEAFVLAGEGSRFFGCTADSPTRIGFAVPDTGHGINVTLSGCACIVSHWGDRIPAPASVLPVYAGKSGLEVPNLVGIDRAGGRLADVWVRAKDDATFRTLTIGSGGNLRMPQNQYVGNSRGAFVPSLRVGGSSAGLGHAPWTPQGVVSTVGPQTSFHILIALTGTGTGSGDLTIAGLPFTGPAFPGLMADLLFPVAVRDADVSGAVVARLKQGSDVLVLEDAASGRPLTGAVLTATTAFSVAGTFLGGL